MAPRGVPHSDPSRWAPACRPRSMVSSTLADENERRKQGSRAEVGAAATGSMPQRCRNQGDPRVRHKLSIFAAKRGGPSRGSRGGDRGCLVGGGHWRPPPTLVQP
jgi:hypothetical protein